MRDAEEKRRFQVEAKLPKKPKEIKRVERKPLPEGSTPFDLETTGENLWFVNDRGFIRLVGYHDEKNTLVYTKADRLVERISTTNGPIIGHNIMGYDCLILSRLYGLDILEMARQDRLYDTKLVCFLADPPLARTSVGEAEKIYSLENQAQKYLGFGKMGDLKALARQFGGFGLIPQDNMDYVRYLEGDVEATKGLAEILELDDYARREHKIAAIAATISLEGFRIDVPLLEKRIRSAEERRVEKLEWLQGHGLPGPETSKAPHRTNVGKEAIIAAFEALDVELPKSPKGNVKMGKDVMEDLIDRYDDTPEVVELAQTIMSLNGLRHLDDNIKSNLIGDRVHPMISLRQAAGRWSSTDPGIMTAGKRGGRVIERAVFLPDNEDHVLISIDLSQIDQRAVAALSQDHNYLDLFEPGRDLHSEMAVKIFGDKARREDAKPVSHGGAYGMSANRLTQMSPLTVEQASRALSDFYDQFPVMARWQREIREQAGMGLLLDNGFGRWMKPDKDRAYTQSLGLMGQGCARDIFMEGILNLWEAGGDEVIRMIRACIHDELVLSVPKKDHIEITQLVVASLSFDWCPEYGTRPVRVVAAANKPGSDWSKCYDK